LSDILRNVTFNTIYKAKSLVLSKCLSFQRPQLYNTLFTIFKIKNKIVTQYLNSKITFISERYNYNLRNCRDFDIKFSRYDIKARFIHLQVTLIER
jgi:hypothetical protein